MGLPPLRQFWEGHPRNRAPKTPLEDWFAQVRCADWATPSDVKAHYRDASILPSSRVVFSIGGNRYRVVVRINYPYRIVYIRFIGTHMEYDMIDARTI